MSTTVIEALENAKMNIETGKQLPAILPLAAEQLNNAIKALKNGKGINDVIQESVFDEVDTGE